MTKIIVAGMTGKVGSRIAALSAEYAEIELAGAFERPGHKDIGKNISSLVSVADNGIVLAGSLESIINSSDAIIDFTSPEATLTNAKIAAAHKKALVVGTTGMSKDQVAELASFAKDIPIVFAPNMSVGINLLLKVLADISPLLAADFDIEIIEAHHRLKKDAPSGTAMKLAQVIADSIDRNLDEVAVYTRKGITRERPKKDIGMQTIRGGDIVGEHTVMYCGLGERIEITHKASNRDLFARGALKAAIWLNGKKPRLYDMQDVLGLK
jgi:4-hydroxy-tetrahydrodipicolinate reductase